MIAVGAYLQRGTISSLSSQNDYVDVSAPGDKIISTVFGGTTAAYDGTSIALPAHGPDLLPGRILSGLFGIVREAGAPGWDKAFGSGKIWPTEVARLLDANAPPGSPTAIPPISNTPVDFVPEPETGPLQLGYQGTLVEALQTMLEAVGKLSDPPDGYFGHGTEAVVKAFQRDANLTADGIAGSATMHALDVAAGGTPFATLADAGAAVLAFIDVTDDKPLNGWLGLDMKTKQFGPGDQFTWTNAGRRAVLWTCTTTSVTPLTVAACSPCWASPSSNTTARSGTTGSSRSTGTDRLTTDVLWTSMDTSRLDLDRNEARSPNGAPTEPFRLGPSSAVAGVRLPRRPARRSPAAELVLRRLPVRQTCAR